ncbi:MULTISPECIES: HAMP domain-containing sensor histidine kinase [unclassified Micromonospora]|uniref:sensor histidine kinase n=1 Tax=unclassified Micromonospora TaxID=2617518 RepID=UPI001C2318D4|nr:MULTISPECIES: HAMP domain-containing sensor histidine kinase [unclassified Micromonospora]MBU8861638.1 HAMP domain-containing histidine kinase [Micromonospora sp. WMMB482]MDM4781207.1 HAMP domain-containing sensor histidine kinase [Micromonospora sp. b486]
MGSRRAARRRRLRRWGRWTLRSRLVVVVAALTALALVLANAAGLVLLRRTLTDRIDEQLTTVSRPFTRDAAPSYDPHERTRVLPRARLGPEQVVLLYGPDGSLEDVRRSDESATVPKVEPYDRLVARAAGTRPYTVEAADGAAAWRVLVVERGDDRGIAVLAVSLREVEETTDLLLLIDAVVIMVVLLLLASLAAVVVRLGLRPLTRMEQTTAQITGGNLSRRVPDADPHTEPGRLGGALNLMLDRISTEVAARRESERRLRQFIADASHELRTPLTSIRGFAELYRRGGTPPGPELDGTMARIEAEAARMGLLVEDLLLLAQLDHERPLRDQPVDLLAVAADSVRDAHARAPRRRIRLAALDDDGFEPVMVTGDEHRLRQVVANLLNNALQHTPPQARVTVRTGLLRRAPAGPPPVTAVGDPLPAATPAAVLEVTDDGPGLAADQAVRVFERLYRADPSRTRGSGGSGLGLSIVAALVRGHGGRVELLTAPGRGATFRLLLPSVPDADRDELVDLLRTMHS